MASTAILLGLAGAFLPVAEFAVVKFSFTLLRSRMEVVFGCLASHGCPSSIEHVVSASPFFIHHSVYNNELV